MDEGGSPYEVLQRVKAKFHRLRSRGSQDAALRHLEAAILKQLDNRELANADDLIKLLIKAVREDKVPVTSDMCERFTGIWRRYSVIVHSDAEALMLADRVKESAVYMFEVGPDEMDEDATPGMPKWLLARLTVGPYILSAWPHRIGLALGYFAEGFPPTIMYRALHGLMSGLDKREERLMMWARIILTYSSTEPLVKKEPWRVLDEGGSFLDYCHADEGIPGHPLFHFVTMFMRSLQHEHLALSRMVLARYRPLLARDPELEKLAEKAIALRANPRREGRQHTLEDLRSIML